MPDDLRRFVERSLRVLEREAPRFHSRLCECAGGLRVCVRNEGEPFALQFDPRSVTAAPPHGDEHVHLRVDRSTILALVDGELTLEAAIRQDRLHLIGSTTHVARFFDLLLVYTRGGIRCTSFPQLVADFRTP